MKILALVLFVLALVLAWSAYRMPRSRPDVTLPGPANTPAFESLAEFLKGKVLPPDPRNPLPPERPLPHRKEK